ncbi:MAG: orotate phosphoribosyltransferase [Candidatus Sumerlaeia bacterium]|nr:orotate phosphoribosyltransferase [Candidatus Sumerlaeia bacterium]
MSDIRVLELLEETGALKSGHFVLSSGLHSDRYCQCAALFEHPAIAGEVAGIMAAKLREANVEVDIVLSPALGGILWGYELARALNVRSIFAERGADGGFTLRRGFVLRKGMRVLLAEDVVTTGKSVCELLPLVEKAGAEVSAFAAIADRSGGHFKPDAPFHSLVKLIFQTFAPDQVPDWLSSIPVTKPGSRPD